ncbi:hypothetical protein [Cyanobium sp. Morenito 9A2]|uniref:hypothetical protein n=1 Tax=Cyanobium sp. Morenito 9A2 TaxID=2823718 RepID=UPI0020CEEE88|nr:hypothetical protein [Cyanobium sp. Morenito 9A2]MCP9848337.1 hypothetical protein [Cyanobium sp. Morenito 9A2]
MADHTDDPLALSRQFSVALHSRAIDACTDLDELKQVAKTLLEAWQLQASFSAAYGARLLELEPR